MKRRKLLTVGGAIVLGTITGCSGEDGEEEPESTPTPTPTTTVDTGTETTEQTTTDCEPVVVDEDIETDTTWDVADCSQITLDGDIYVTGEATLTIEPGVEVVGKAGSRLTVKDGSTIVAEGESENPISFHGESETPGYWDGIYITSNDSNNSFDYVDIAHGGGNDLANIYIGYGEDGLASVTNSTLRQSKTAGLLVEGGATLSEFAKNEFRENEGAAVYIPTTMVGAIDADSTYVDKNGTDAVRVSDRHVVEDATWPGVPYHFDGDNHQITGGAVTVKPGAQFTFNEGAKITVKEGGSFAAEGTEVSPITFEGASATPGYWHGFHIYSNDPNNSFDHVDIAHGGGNDYANIYVGYGEDGMASVTNSTLRQSKTAGLLVEGGATLSEFTKNEFHDNKGAAVYIPTSMAGAIDADSTYVDNNGIDAVRVSDRHVVEDATWPGVPYHFDGDNHQIAGGAVTVKPGAQFTFNEGAKITVKDGGSFAAEGTEDSPITCEGASATPGYWQGFHIYTNDSNNSFDYVNIAHGGGNDYANIYVGYGDNGLASVTNSTLRQSKTAGLLVEGGATLSEFAKNEFRNNEGAAVYIPTSMVGAIDADSTYVGDNGINAVRVSDRHVEYDATWPGVPYHFDGDNHIISGGAVTVEPGAHFTFNEGAKITVKPGGSFAAEGTEDSPITCEGASATPGYWQGFHIYSNDSNNSFDYVNIAHGGAKDYANIYVGYGDNGLASITNCTLRQSATWGIYVESGATIDASNNTFEGNADGEIGYE